MSSSDPLERREEVLRTALADMQQRVRIDALDGAQVYIIRDGTSVRDEQSYPANPDVTFVPGDEAIMLKIGAGYFVICKNGRN